MTYDLMKKMYLSLVMGFSMMAIPCQAQHVSFGPLHSPDSPREDWLLPGDTVYQDGTKRIYSGKPMPYKPMAYKPLSDKGDLANEENADYGKGYGADYSKENSDDSKEYIPSYTWGGLHKGLNFSVDLSAFATFGKNAPHRGGFTQTIDATYLTPLTKDNKLWTALGGYVTNTNYGGDSYHDGGIYGILGYKLNEHWEAYVYGQLSISNNYNSIYGRYGYGAYSPWGYGYGGFAPWGYGMNPWRYGMMGSVMPGGYGMGVPGANVLGAGVRYTNKNFSLGINIEGVWYDNKTPSYYKQYDYPVPEAPRK